MHGASFISPSAILTSAMGHCAPRAKPVSADHPRLRCLTFLILQQLMMAMVPISAGSPSPDSSSSNSSSGTTTVYVDVFHGSNATDCGTGEANACDTISRALSHETDNQPILIYLVAPRNTTSSENTVVPDIILNAMNITIDGANAGPIELMFDADNVKRSGSQDPSSSWLTFTNCTGIQIQNLQLDLNNFSGTSAILFKNSMGCAVKGSLFRFRPLYCTSLLVYNSWPFQVTSTTMLGNGLPQTAPPDTNPTHNTSSLMIQVLCSHQACLENRTTADDDDCCSGRPARSAAVTPQFHVTSCHFKHLGPHKLTHTYYRNSSEGGIAISFLVAGNSGARLSIIDTHFLNNSSPIDTTVKLIFAKGALSGWVSITDSTFLDNNGYVGGGVVYSIGDANAASDHRLQLENTMFISNRALLEGGAIAADLMAGNTSLDKVRITNCTFRDNIGGVDFTSGLVGGALSMVSSSVVTRLTPTGPVLRIINSTFEKNRATYGAALFMKGMVTNIHSVSMIGQMDGSCVHSALSITTLYGTQTYINNTGSIFGGVFALYDFSLLNFDEDINATFQSNSAAYGGGVIFADQSSSTPDISQHIQFSTNVSDPKKCFLGTPGLAYFNYSGTSNDSKVTFLDNTAKSGGDIQANSFSCCSGSAMLPYKNLGDRYRANVGRTPGKVASGPVWMFLTSTTSPCLKPLAGLAGTLWHVTNSCNRSTIHDLFDANNQTYQYDLVNYLQGFLESTFLFQQNVSGVGAYPDGRYFFLMPWAMTTWRWYYPRTTPGTVSPVELDYPPDSDLYNTSHLGNMTLYPASGEVFRLDVDVVDFYFNLVSSPCILKVNDGEALIQHEGYQYGLKDIVNFGTLNTLQLALVGPVGTTGTLRLSVQSQIRSNTFTDLLVPFRISPCHLGYQPSALMSDKEKAKEYINSVGIQHMDSGNNELACHCLSGTSGVHSCEEGKDLVMSWEFWAGTGHEGTYTPSSARQPWLINDLAAFESKRSNRTFSTGRCSLSYCTDHGRTNWNLQSTMPCSPSQYRRGILCAECQEGYYLTGFFSQPCVTCSAGASVRNTFMMFMGVFMYIGFFIAVMSYFEIGRSSNFDSWVNYDQTCAFIVRRQVAMTTFTTFSLPLCMRWLTASLQVVLLYTTTASMLIWVGLIFQLSRVTAFRRTFHTGSIIPTLWAVLSFCFASAIFPSFLLFSCHTFNGEYVFFSDARIRCGSSEHMPYLLFGILVICVVCISLPVLFYVKRNTPRFKPLFDVYLGHVKENRTWWIFYNMFRRVVLAMISSQIDNESLVRQLLLAVCVLAMLIVQYIAQPYRRELDNTIEFLCLSNAVLFAIVNLPTQSDINDNYQAVLWIVFAIPTLAFMAYGLYLHRKKVSNLFKRSTRYRLGVTSTETTQGDEDDFATESTPLTSSERVRVKIWTLQAQPGELRDDLLLDSD